MEVRTRSKTGAKVKKRFRVVDLGRVDYDDDVEEETKKLKSTDPNVGQQKKGRKNTQQSPTTPKQTPRQVKGTSRRSDSSKSMKTGSKKDSPKEGSWPTEIETNSPSSSRPKHRKPSCESMPLHNVASHADSKDKEAVGSAPTLNLDIFTTATVRLSEDLVKLLPKSTLQDIARKYILTQPEDGCVLQGTQENLDKARSELNKMIADAMAAKSTIPSQGNNIGSDSLGKARQMKQDSKGRRPKAQKPIGECDDSGRVVNKSTSGKNGIQGRADAHFTNEEEEGDGSGTVEQQSNEDLSATDDLEVIGRLTVCNYEAEPPSPVSPASIKKDPSEVADSHVKFVDVCTRLDQYLCNICGNMQTARKEWLDHCQSAHPDWELHLSLEGRSRCDVCWLDVSNLEEHRQAHFNSVGLIYPMSILMRHWALSQRQATVKQSNMITSCFTCRECESEEKFYSLRRWLLHTQLHCSRTRDFRDPELDEVVPIEDESGNKVCLRCHLCSEYFPEAAIEDFHQHLSEHIVMPPIRCKLCEFASFNREVIEVHVKDAHDIQADQQMEGFLLEPTSLEGLMLNPNFEFGIVKNNLLLCPDCKYEAPSVCEFKRHSKTCGGRVTELAPFHHPQTAVSTQKRKKKLVTEMTTRRRCRKLKDDRSTEKDVGLLPESISGDGNESDDEEKLECDICRFQFSSSDRRNSHRRMHMHTGQKVMASGIMLSSWAEVDRQDRVNPGNQEKVNYYYCQSCKIYSGTWWSWLLHIKQVCPVKRPDTLPQGEEVHFCQFTEENIADTTFVCHFCDKPMKGLQALQTHIVTHRNVQGFQCGVCGLVCLSSDKCYQHIQVCHEDWADLYLDIKDTVVYKEYLKLGELYPVDRAGENENSTAVKSVVRVNRTSCRMCGQICLNQSVRNLHEKTHLNGDNSLKKSFWLYLLWLYQQLEILKALEQERVQAIIDKQEEGLPHSIHEKALYHLYHGKGTWYECTSCKIRFDSQHEWDKHVSKWKCFSQGDKIKLRQCAQVGYYCPVCNEILGSYRTLFIFHLKEHEKKMLLYGCRSCAFMCESAQAYATHVIVHHSTVSDMDLLTDAIVTRAGVVGRRKCKLCDFVGKKAELKTHLSTHDTDSVNAILTDGGLDRTNLLCLVQETLGIECIWKCKLCEFTGIREYVFAHMRNVHLDEIENDTLSDDLDLVEEKEVEEVENEEETDATARDASRDDVEEKSCPICFKTFSRSLNKLELHLAHHFWDENHTRYKKSALHIHKQRLVSQGKTEDEIIETLSAMLQTAYSADERSRLIKQLKQADDEKEEDHNNSAETTVGLADKFPILSSVMEECANNKRQCPSCDKLFHSEQDARKHLQDNHLNSGSYSCCHCDVECDGLSVLAKHLKSHEPRVLHQCASCSYIDIKKSAVIRHAREAHDPMIPKCADCGATYCSDVALEHHIITSHQQKTNWICDKCGKTFLARRSLYKHTVSVHNEAREQRRKEREANRLTECPMCAYKNPIPSVVRRHIQSVHKEKKFTCPYCPSKFEYERQMTKHISIKHLRTANVDCDLCGKTFPGIYCLRQHIRRVHKREYKHFCPVCGKGFVEKHKMLLHAEIHKPLEEQNRKFVCKVCNKRFLQLANCRDHEATHAGKKAFSCEICGKGFNYRVSLLRHQQCHIQVKTHVCTLCNKSFKTQKYMVNHIQRVHEGKRYPIKAKVAIPTAEAVDMGSMGLSSSGVVVSGLQTEVTSRMQSVQVVSNSKPLQILMDDGQIVTASSVLSQILSKDGGAGSTNAVLTHQGKALQFITEDGSTIPATTLLAAQQGDSGEVLSVPEDVGIQFMAVDPQELIGNMDLEKDPHHVVKEEHNAEGGGEEEEEESMYFMCGVCNKLFESQEATQLHLATHAEETVDSSQDSNAVEEVEGLPEIAPNGTLQVVASSNTGDTIVEWAGAKNWELVEVANALTDLSG